MRLALVLLLAVPGSPRPVVAVHATLVASEPAAKSRLETSPRRVRLVFSEPIEGSLARITIVPGRGTPLVLHPAADPRDVHAIIAPLDSLGTGDYRVDWRIVSADGHPVEGSYRFSIGSSASAAVSDTSAPVAAPVDTEPQVAPTGEPEAEDESETWGPAIAGAPVIPAVLRGAGLGALAAATGMLVLLAISGRDAPQAGDSRVRSLVTTLSVASALLLTSHALAWIVNTSPEHTLDATWIGAALNTTVGRVELWRTGLAVLALWAWWLARRPRLALAFAAAALAVSGAVGHPAAIRPVVTIPAKALHLLATGVWLGGLLWLVTRPANDSASRFALDARRVSSAALASVIAIAATGILQTVLFLPSLGDIATSPYGWLALAKTAGLVVLIAFGAYNRQRVMPRLAGEVSDAAGAISLRASVRREIVVMTLVILLGGLLAYVPPPGEGMDAPTTSTSSS